MEILLIIILCGVLALCGYHFFVKKQKSSEIVKEHLPVENHEVAEPQVVKKKKKYYNNKNKKPTTK
jgi:hypothetical protein